MIKILDLHFQIEGTIAAFLLEIDAGLALVECGPHSTFPNLKQHIEDSGYAIEDIKHVFLTHIHFDHAGAAWALAEHGATVYVHPRGYKHLNDPTRLYNSAKKIYGDQMEQLWGLMKPIPETLLVAVDDEAEIKVGNTILKAYHTPGHASHHIAWQLDNKLFAGDVAGCKMGDKSPVVPPCPPPDIDVELWKKSIEKVKSLPIDSIYLTHFGQYDNVEGHLKELEQRLEDWSQWIGSRYNAGKKPQELIAEFEAYNASYLKDYGLTEQDIVAYNIMNPAAGNVYGLHRYWSKKETT